ncbi:sensor histidine kinase [Streptomyces cirratus]
MPTPPSRRPPRSAASSGTSTTAPRPASSHSGFSLATAEQLMDRDPEQAKALMGEARAGAAASLTELRELIRGISPPVLSERGLVDAVRALALDVPLGVSVSAGGGPLRLDPSIESAVYFGVAELLTNAVKHAGAGPGRPSASHGTARASSWRSRTTAGAGPNSAPAAGSPACAAAWPPSTARS